VAFEAWLVLYLYKNVVGELQPKRTLAASCGFLAAARLSCSFCMRSTVAPLALLQFPFLAQIFFDATKIKKEIFRNDAYAVMKEQ